MLVEILAQLNNDEQRFQCLQRLKSKLSNLKLTRTEVKTIVDLFQTFSDEQRSKLYESLISQTKSFDELSIGSVSFSIESNSVGKFLLPVDSSVDRNSSFERLQSISIRTKSFMMKAIKETFERLKQTSS